MSWIAFDPGRTMTRSRWACLAAILAATLTSRAQPTLDVLTIRLPMSNVHLLKTETPVLIDAGGRHDAADLDAGLKAHGLTMKDIRLVVLTHGHSDHAGLAARLQKEGAAQVALGKGDVPMARAGHHGTLQPTSFTGRVLDWVAIDPAFPPFAPDIVVERELDLKPWGVDGKAMAMPGHTPGSLVVLLSGRRAIVGDMVLGGYLGGRVSPQVAGMHYFQADVVRNHSNIRQLLRPGVTTFYLGHGGPVSSDSVLQAWPDLIP